MSTAIVFPSLLLVTVTIWFSLQIGSNKGKRGVGKKWKNSDSCTDSTALLTLPVTLYLDFQ